ncbi:DNA replication and repair protein RecF [Segetibacter sp.]|jgi:DNA replication and repair protein RecF|uniref:DNA replication/repair protein RecF n=1 Tax=Segetibacter sp. TaxID=2231182 RepID=UPI0026178B9F|nr:DNA replication and repair protein RecF [Segetibacter sp.]MCW3080613.1 recombination and repair protein RecF [Segetibacter sp.]
MLQLNNISLYQFKNYRQQSLQFKENIVGICGNNGLGKTNLLDAIYFLCFTKSYFSKTDNASVHHGLQGLRIEGNFTRNGETEKVVCILRENNKKEIQRNGEDYKRFSAHIGQFPAVVIAPDDVELITGTSETRRKYLDTLLSQLDSNYLQNLIDYNKVLQQRNSLLKSVGERGYLDDSLLDILSQQLIKPGNYIFDCRKKFLLSYLPEVAESYLKIAGTHERVILAYYSPLFENSFESLLATFRQKDLMLQRTTIGIHRDDIELKLNNENFKNIASQGQRKSLLFALKLKEFDELKSAKGFAPILLLDDVFEKLDAGRMQNLLQHVCVENRSQVFITDTHKERLEQALGKLGVRYQLVEL